ncbi:Branched-chain amino acid transport system permease protein LivM (TC 3.A.1.4.1) [Olavius sp. associated proteobacterium Delta 1]|nr:Branched-chain amino acid transport system permease protein LivM (TC 3.A.1.4.1) [Olavius sp. associated proteobacterium Delta 1]
MKLLNLKILGLIIVIAVALVLPLAISDYWQYVLTVAFFYTIMAASWNLLGGYTGQFSLAHHTFGMIGAYTSSLLMAKAGAAFWISIPAAIVFTMVLSLILGIVCLRVHGLYLALITWAFAEVIRNYFRLHYAFTGGDRGLDAPLLFGTLQPTPYYYFFLGLTVLSIALIAVLMHSRIGYYLRSIRDDAIAARSMGVNIVRYKVLAFIVASGIAGMAGAFYGHTIGLISPVLGDFNEMAMIIIFVVIGGMRTLAGPVIGALSVRITMEFLREQSEIRIIILSALVIIIMRFFNGGLMELVRRIRKWIGKEQESVSAYQQQG